MKSSLLALFFTFPLFLMGQIGNPSFENGNEDSVASWSLIKGKGGAYTSYTYKDSTGNTTAEAVDGDKFLVLDGASDDEAVISAQFALNENFAALYANFIYLHDDVDQRFSVEIVYLDWISDSSANDTIMHRVERINPNSQSDQRVYDWLEFEIPINEDYFFSKEKPDSCVITVRTNAGTSTSKMNVLLLDDFYFSERIVFSVPDLQRTRTTVFPNPSSGQINIGNLKQGDRIVITDLQGRIVYGELANGQTELRIDLVQSGLYMMTIRNESYQESKKLVINR